METLKSKVVIVNFHGSVILPYCIKAKKMYEHNALGYCLGLALICLTKVRSSRARCPVTALICNYSPHHPGEGLGIAVKMSGALTKNLPYSAGEIPRVCFI